MGIYKTCSQGLIEILASEKRKETIEKEHKLVAETLKLIAYGKVLDSDEKKTTDHNLKDGDFIVAMVQKNKPPKKKTHNLFKIC